MDNPWMRRTQAKVQAEAAVQAKNHKECWLDKRSEQKLLFKTALACHFASQV
jgi:hypothetical protein